MRFKNINKKYLLTLINVIMLNRKKNIEIQNWNWKTVQFLRNQNHEMEQVKNKSYENKDKILVIVSCHTYGKLRWNAINSIMKFLNEINDIDIVIVNSSNLQLSENLKNIYKSNYIKYYEIDNDKFYGFSKWYYAIENVEIDNYKYITFINDSILVHSSIKHFFDYTRNKDVDIFGYNDSSQICYHYQSYLFSIKSQCIQNFKKMFLDYKHLINNYNDVVNYYELKMLEYFKTRDCFLKLTEIDILNNKNIFFSNDYIYLNLRKNGYLPFTKLKRININ